MVNKSIMSLLILLLFAWGTIAEADDKDTISIYGYANTPCSGWVNFNRSDRKIFDIWLRGVFTGANIASPDMQITQDLNPSHIEIYIDKYCADNPIESLASVTYALISELKVKSITKGTLGNNDGRPIYHTKQEQLKIDQNIQKALSEFNQEKRK